MKNTNKNISLNLNTAIVISLCIHIGLVALVWLLSMVNIIQIGGGQYGQGEVVSAVMVDTEQVSSEYKRTQQQEQSRREAEEKIKQAALEQ